MQLHSNSTLINKKPLHNVQLGNMLNSKTTDHTDNYIPQQISCSTPINNRELHSNSDIQLSNILNTTDVNQSTKNVLKKNVTDDGTFQSNISESTVPSGATDILNAIGDDWMISPTEIHDDNNNLDFDNNDRNNYDAQENRCDNNELAKDPKEDNSSMEIYSLQDVPPLDIRNVQVPHSKDSSSKRSVKKYFCPYCKKLLTKFARHLEIKHKTEADVQKFIHLKKGTHERAKIIAAIRNHGSLLHNTHDELNTGILVTVRQGQGKYKKTVDDYTCCSNCKGFYSKRTIRIHYKKCKPTHKKGVHEIAVMGRRVTGYIHSYANKVLREIVFPVLRDDAVTRCIKYDELLILFGNKECERYTSTHQHDMIRAHLRLLGRYKLAVQEIDKKIDDF